MKFIERSIKGVMLISGVLTCTMFYALLAPDAALTSSFGQTVDGPVAEIVVRNWGALIGLMGVLLIYGAFQESVRRVALVVAGASKVMFIALVLSLGKEFLQHQVGVSVIVDSVMVLLFIVYLTTGTESKSTR